MRFGVLSWMLVTFGLGLSACRTPDCAPLRFSSWISYVFRGKDVGLCSFFVDGIHQGDGDQGFRRLLGVLRSRPQGSLVVVVSRTGNAVGANDWYPLEDERARREFADLLTHRPTVMYCSLSETDIDPSDLALVTWWAESEKELSAASYYYGHRSFGRGPRALQAVLLKVADEKKRGLMVLGQHTAARSDGAATWSNGAPAGEDANLLDEISRRLHIAIVPVKPVPDRAVWRQLLDELR